MLKAISGAPAYGLSEEDTARWMKVAVQAPMLKEFDREIKPRLNEAFAGAGGLFSSRRSDALGRGLGDLNDKYSELLGKAQLDTRTLAAQLAESAANRSLAVAQGADQAQRQNWQMQQPWANPYLNLGLNYIGQNQTLAYQNQGNQSGGFGGAVQGGLGGAYIGSQIGSVVPGIGTGIGAGIGAVAGGIGGLF